MRKIREVISGKLILACTYVLSAFLLLQAHAQGAVASFFENDSEGWTAIGDTISGVEYLPKGGRIGGGLSVRDEAVGGVWYFVAGTQYLGDQHQNYDKFLQFDLRQVVAGAINQFLNDDVILESGGLRLVYDLPTKPSTSGAWTSFSVALSEKAPWRVGSRTGSIASQLQVQTVLSNLTSLRIRGEYQTGGDVGYLDNVLFGAVTNPGPPSLTIGLLPVLTITGTLGASYRIEYSDGIDPTTWKLLQTIRLSQSPYDFFDRSAETHPRRYYRAVLADSQ